MYKKFIDNSRSIESKLNLLFNNMNEGVALHKLVFDANGKISDYIIERVNPSYEKILNLKRENVEGKLSTEVYGVKEPPYLKEYSQVAFSGKPCYFETYFEPLQKYFSISVSPWEENGFATIFNDITAKKKADEQIKNLFDQNELLLKELHHRVTNSISAINSLLYLQSEKITNPEASAILKDAGNRLRSMGLLHKKLYKSSTLQDCDVKDYLNFPHFSVGAV